MLTRHTIVRAARHRARLLRCAGGVDSPKTHALPIILLSSSSRGLSLPSPCWFAWVRGACEVVPGSLPDNDLPEKDSGFGSYHTYGRFSDVSSNNFAPPPPPPARAPFFLRFVLFRPSIVACRAARARSPGAFDFAPPAPSRLARKRLPSFPSPALAARASRTSSITWPTMPWR